MRSIVTEKYTTTRQGRPCIYDGDSRHQQDPVKNNAINIEGITLLYITVFVLHH